MKTNIKMRVTPEQNIEIQKICSANGIKCFGSDNINLKFKSLPFLMLVARFEMSLEYSTDEKWYLESGLEEVDADLFIRTNGTCEETKGHPHAELMAEYAKDAAETDRPWERWELLSQDGKRWIQLSYHPDWQVLFTYRRKPQRRTVTMPDGTVLPEPVREALKDGGRYYVADNTLSEMVDTQEWVGDIIDYNCLKRGLIHRTEEDAKAWAEYLLSLTQRS